MNLMEKLLLIEQYYRQNRAVGHTEAMLRGVQNIDKVAVLSPTMRMGDILVKHRNPKAKLISWSSDLEGLQGLNLPLILDHTMIEVFCREMIEKILELTDGHKIAYGPPIRHFKEKEVKT